ncbi:MAG TPA: patatin-like phospholipase family protein [Acidimicrobiales bacterium]|jgi:NTE family protein|nr:patatin-like phospholipase family protein [Acidimicrobiales bacterium]
MTSVALVLGAGGLVGQAFHAGALAALEGELGWDPRSSDVIVGSSAGSITGTLLRLGVTASDLQAIAQGTPLSDEGALLVERILPDPSDLPTPTPRDWLRPWRPPSAALVVRIAGRPWSFRPSVAAMTMLPAGRIDLTDRAVPLHEMVGDRWPEDLWICAARRTDGARVVFGRPGAPRAPLAAAVLASCAIPAYFAPVAIDGVEYFDGGVHSGTNADVLRARRPELVVVISPMSAARPPIGAADGILRWSAHRRLEREALRLERTGATVVRIEPGASSMDAMGLRPLDDDRSQRVATAAYDETVRLVAEGHLADRLRAATGAVRGRGVVADGPGTGAAVGVRSEAAGPAPRPDGP